MAQQGTTRIVSPSTKSAPPSIPDKLYFRIGEVAELCGVPTYVLRFWESEFPQLKPNKGGTGQRLYRRKDVETALRIRALLYEGKFTIPGARQALRTELERSGTAPQLSLAMAENEGAKPEVKTTPDRKSLDHLRNELRDLREMLVLPATARPKRSAIQPIREEQAAGPLTEKLFE